LVAVALSQTSRQQAFLNTSFYRQVVQSSDLAFDLNYTIFDFGGRSGRIDQAKGRDYLQLTLTSMTRIGE
jgi:hypothetical protein